MRAQMGIDAPNFGPLTDVMLLDSPAVLPGGALACLEIVDSIWSGYRFALEDNTADGSSAAWVAVGPPLPLDDLAALPVTMSVDGQVVERTTGAAAGGHPAAGLAWLAGQLAGNRISATFGDSGCTVSRAAA